MLTRMDRWALNNETRKIGFTYFIERLTLHRLATTRHNSSLTNVISSAAEQFPHSLRIVRRPLTPLCNQLCPAIPIPSPSLRWVHSEIGEMKNYRCKLESLKKESFLSGWSHQDEEPSRSPRTASSLHHFTDSRCRTEIRFSIYVRR